MEKIAYILLYPMSLLPFGVIHLLSDFTSLMLYHVVRYRRKVVRGNLTTAFPEKSAEEIKDIERRFYRNFCAIFLHSIKLLSISQKELEKRLVFTGQEGPSKFLEQGRNCAFLLGHYSNWEWLSCTPMAMPANSVTGLIYNPQRNKAIDYLFQRIRTSQPNGLIVPKKDILRHLARLKQEGVPNAFGYIADQAPKWQNIHLWLPFLNHETPVFTGAERIIRKRNDATFYIGMKSVKRGYYHAHFYPLSDDPASLPEHELTRRFFAMLERSIKEDPVQYLWTHNRWKRTREEFERRFEIVNGKVIEKKSEE